MDDALTKLELKFNSKPNAKSSNQSHQHLSLSATQLDLLTRKARAVDSLEPEVDKASVADSLEDLPLLDNCDFLNSDYDSAAAGHWFKKDELNWENVRVERAIKHWRSSVKVSNADLPKLQRQLIEIQIQAKPFVSTEAFDYYHAREVRQHEGKFLSCVIKIHRTRAKPDWFSKLQAQIIAKDWSYAFNALLASRGQRSLQFPEAAILELAEREHVFCKADFFEVIEPPWHDQELHALASAFKHFLYWKTDHKIVCSRLWTDKICGHLLEPELHSLDGDLFGRSDRGDEAFYSFVNSHRCGEFCKKAGAPMIEDRVYETLRIGRQEKCPDLITHEDAIRFKALRSNLRKIQTLSLKTKVHNSPWTIDLYIFPSLTALRIDRVKIAKFIVPANLTRTLQKLEVIGSVDTISAVLQPDFGFVQPRNDSDLITWGRLKKLTVSDSNIVFTDRCLSRLPSIVKINLSHNQIEAIRNLNECVGLRELDLRNNQISSVHKINQAVGNVQMLLLTSNLISDPSPLSKLFGLKLLDLSYNLISDVSLIKGLSKLPYLKMLWLKGNPIAYTKSYRINVICELISIFEDPDRLPFELDSDSVSANEIKRAKKVCNGEEEAEDGLVEPAVEFISFKPFRKVIPLPIGVRAGDKAKQTVKVKRKKRTAEILNGSVKEEEVENTTMEPKEIERNPVDDDFDLAMEYFSSRISSMPKATSDRCKALMKQATVGDCPHKRQPQMFGKSPPQNEGDALWSTYRGMTTLDAKRLFISTVEHFDPGWKLMEAGRGAGPLDIPDVPAKNEPLRTFVSVKSRNQEVSLNALREEFGQDLMDTFSFTCECFFDDSCPERPPNSPCELILLLSHFVIQEKDINTQSTRYRRRTNQITDFDVYSDEIKINFPGYAIRYKFQNQAQHSLFERKLATAILTDNVYRFLENDKFMGRMPNLLSIPDKKYSPVKLSRLSQEIQSRKVDNGKRELSISQTTSQENSIQNFSKRELSHSHENSIQNFPNTHASNVSLSPSDPVTFQSSAYSQSGCTSMYTDSVDTESLSRSKRDLSDAVKRFWMQRMVNEIDEEFSQRYTCRHLKFRSNDKICERNVIILVWDQHIFILHSKGKHDGEKPSTLFYGHISTLQAIERGFHHQYFSLDCQEKCHTFMTRDPARTREICSRLNKIRNECMGHSKIIVEDSLTLPRILQEVELGAKVALYSHVYVPTEEKSRKTFTMRNGMHVLAQTLILTEHAIYLCDEDCLFLMHPKALTQSKRRRLETSTRFNVIQQNKLLSISNIRASDFQPQGFTIEFSNGIDPWRLICQSSNSKLLNDLMSQTQRLVHSRSTFNTFSSPSSSFDNHLQNADLERVVIDLP